MNMNPEESKRMQKLAGIIKESTEHKKEESEPGFTNFEFDNNMDVNTDNNNLFQELADSDSQ